MTFQLGRIPPSKTTPPRRPIGPPHRKQSAKSGMSPFLTLDLYNAAGQDRSDRAMQPADGDGRR